MRIYNLFGRFPLPSPLNPSSPCMGYSCTVEVATQEDTAYVAGQTQTRTHFVGHPLKGRIRENAVLCVRLMQTRTQFSRHSFIELTRKAQPML